MTIDEYLRQPQELKRKYERLYKRLLVMETRVTSPRDPLNTIGVQSRTGENAAETKLLDFIDAHNEYKDVVERYRETRKNILTAIDYVLYWQGSLIYQVYVRNVAVEEEATLTGADEILHTDDRREILAKLGEAKEALAAQLRAQGVTIE